MWPGGSGDWLPGVARKFRPKFPQCKLTSEMRTISKRTQYGLKAMIALGRKYREGPVMIGTLAREESIPVKFLEVILLDMKSKGLVGSKLGRNGGYFLTRPPSGVTIGSIVRLIEGPLAPLPCASETAFRPCEECQDIEHCPTRIIMRRVRDAMSDVLDRTTLADLIAQADVGKKRNIQSKDEALMYYI